MADERAREARALQLSIRDTLNVTAQPTDIGREALLHLLDLAEIVSELAHEVEYVWSTLETIDPGRATIARTQYRAALLRRISER